MFTAFRAVKKEGKFMYTFKKTSVLLSLGLLTTAGALSQGNGKNVLFLMSDDFNYWLHDGGNGYYPHAKTPNLDALANKGVHFTAAYNSSPVCNPSRNALWSGYRPSTTGIDNNAGGFVRDKAGFANIVTMNQFFHTNGYWMYGNGKLWHPGKTSKNSKDNDGVNWAQKWSELPEGGSGCNGGTYKKWKGDQYGWSGNDAAMTTSNCADYKLAVDAANFIKNYNKQQPFFLACGFFRPHADFNSPKKYWDEIAPADNSFLKPGIGVESRYLTGNGNSVHNQIVSQGKWADAIHGYLASMKLTDDNVQVILDALKEKGLDDNTIIVFCGDHGWHLGEHGHWGKFTRWNDANQTTLIIYDPGAKGNGKKCHYPVSLQDLFPTLMVLTGLAEEGAPRSIEGNSLKHLLDYPDDDRWNYPAILGYSGQIYMRTNQYWYVPGESKLFDLQKDPWETDNLWGKVDNNVKTQLATEQSYWVNIGKRMANDLKTSGSVSESNKYVQPLLSPLEECTDLEKPSKPGQPQVIEALEKSIKISWTPSVDNIGVTGYHVYVNGVRKLNSPDTVVTLLGLECETDYSLQIVAFDACDNLSESSSSTLVKTQKCTVIEGCQENPTLTDLGNGSQQGQSRYHLAPASINANGTRVYAVYYDEGGEGIAYHDKDDFTVWTGTQIRTSEGVDNLDKDGDGIPETGKTAIGEWLEYTLNFVESGKYKFSVNAASIGSGKFFLKMNNQVVSCLLTLSGTANLSTYSDNSYNDIIEIVSGENVLTIVFEGDNINLNHFEFTKVGELDNPSRISMNPVERVNKIMYLLTPIASANHTLRVNVLYSNPTLRIRITDVNGRVHMDNGFAGEFEDMEIELPLDMKPGVYIITAIDDNTTESYKFLLK
jgi:arylsulfatase A-like enzyme/chitodextrinase